MLILIKGANSSGKSLYAEKLASRIRQGDLYYVATMNPYGEEGQARIAKHRKQRQGLGFRTVEKLYDIDQIAVTPDSLVLLEDVSNLLANILFREQPGDWQNAFGEIMALSEKCRHFIVVTIDELSEEGFSGETKGYIQDLNRLNRRLQDCAAMVVQMKNGEPCIIKGDRNEIS
ncbi:MAG: bifunctional adenosylcobinamide kinase/adenosylcobinamide-phosphate guanylyltransferase [Firmicutes bacterium]|nr:bifunctional adenosylcobinamide kinase/adenosylcobinamide-phosphate guanylyltransferase [Bacillota bacterium]